MRATLVLVTVPALLAGCECLNALEVKESTLRVITDCGGAEEQFDLPFRITPADPTGLLKEYLDPLNIGQDLPAGLRCELAEREALSLDSDPRELANVRCSSMGFGFSEEAAALLCEGTFQVARRVGESEVFFLCEAQNTLGSDTTWWIPDCKFVNAVGGPADLPEGHATSCRAFVDLLPDPADAEVAP